MSVDQSPTPTPTAERPPERSEAFPNLRQRFEAACDSFESAWRNGRAPSIEEYLNWVETAEQTELLQELIELDLYYRRQAGETVQRSDYCSRFAALGDGSVLLNSAEAASSPTPPTPITPSGDKRSTGHLPQRGFGYEILSEIGRGGMGVVYLARQIRLNRLVALKMILAGEFASFEERVRFRREAETAARLQHPHIVQVYDVGEHEGQAYLAMEFVRGGTLADWLHGLPRPPQQAAAMIETLAHAIQHAHEQGIVHRDLKPANVLLTGGTGPWNDSEADAAAIAPRDPSPVIAVTPPPIGGDGEKSQTPVPAVTEVRTPLSPNAERRDEPERTLADASHGESLIAEQSTTLPRPKIADFGLAKVLGHDVTMTRTGALMGTPSYMAPESTGGGDHIGPAADIYSLGAILYEAITGRPPFRGVHFVDTIEQVRSQEPVTPRSLQPKIPRDLETICLTCLRKNPASRYASAQALAADLRHFLNGEPIAARPTGMWESAVRWMKRRPGPAVGIVSLSLTAAIVLMLSLYFNARLALSLSETQTQREVVRRQRDEVIRQRDKLTEQQRIIVKERDKADTQRDEAHRQREAAEFATYTTEVLLADRYLQDGQHSAADQILARHRPLPSQPDHRGFEWYHLWSRCHREAWTITPRMGVVSDGMLSPDGKLLVICGNDGSIVLWDTATRRDRHVLKPPVAAANREIRYAAMMPAALFSPDGSTLATCDGDVRLWDVDTGRERSPDGKPLQSKARSIAISSTGQTLGVGGEDGTVTLWNIAQRTIYRQWKVSPNEIARVVFSPDRKLFALISVTSPGQGAQFWTIQTSQRVHEILHREKATVSDVAFSSDGKLIAVAEGSLQLERVTGRVTLLDASTFAVRWTVETPLDGLNRVAFDPDGQTLWTGADSGILRRWSVDQGSEIPGLVGHVSRISALHLRDAGRGMLTTGYDKSVKYWTPREPTEPYVWQYPHSDAPQTFTLSPNGRWLAIKDISGRFRVWNTETKQASDWSIDADGQTPLQFTADSEQVLTTTPKALTLRNVVSGRPAFTIDNAEVSHLSQTILSPDGRLLAAISSEPKSILIWDGHTGTLLQRITVRPDTTLSCLAFSHNSDRLAVSHRAGKTACIDIIRGPDLRIPDGTNRQNTVPTSSLESLRLATMHVGTAYHLPSVMVFCPQDQALLASGRNGHITHYAFTTDHLERIASHNSPVDWLAVDASGRTAISGSQSGVIKLTDPIRHRERFVLQYSTPDFAGMSLAKDTNTIVTATKSGLFTFWRAPPETPIWPRQPAN